MAPETLESNDGDVVVRCFVFLSAALISTTVYHIVLPSGADIRGALRMILYTETNETD